MVIVVDDVKYNLNTITDYSKLYDYLYNKGDSLFKKYDPCHITKTSCYLSEHGFQDHPFCCSRCKHLTESGCSVHSLACKLHMCGSLKYHRQKSSDPIPEEFLIEINKLNNIANKIGIMVRYSKTENININLRGINNDCNSKRTRSK